MLSFKKPQDVQDVQNKKIISFKNTEELQVEERRAKMYNAQIVLNFSKPGNPEINVTEYVEQPNKQEKQENQQDLDNLQKLEVEMIKKTEILEKHIADKIISEKLELLIKRQEELWQEKEKLLRSEIESLQAKQNVQNVQNVQNNIKLEWDERQRQEFSRVRSETRRSRSPARRRSRSPARRRSRSPKREKLSHLVTYKYVFNDRRYLNLLLNDIRKSENHRIAKNIKFETLRDVFFKESKDSLYAVLDVLNKRQVNRISNNALSILEFLSNYLRSSMFLDRALSSMDLRDIIKFYKSKPCRITSIIIIRGVTQGTFNVELFEALISQTIKQKTITKTILLQYCTSAEYHSLNFTNSDGQVRTISIVDIMRAIDCYHDSLSDKNYNINRNSRLSVEAIELFASFASVASLH